MRFIVTFTTYKKKIPYMWLDSKINKQKKKMEKNLENLSEEKVNGIAKFFNFRFSMDLHHLHVS